MYAILMVLYLVIAYLLASALDPIARGLGKFFGKITFSGDPKKAYWTIHARVRRRRAIVVGVLVLIVWILFLGIAMVITNTTIRTRIVSVELLFVSAIIAVVVPVLMYRTHRPNVVPQSVSVAGDNHMFRDFVRRVDTLSITAGITAPKVVLWAHRVPGIFLAIPFGTKEPVLYVTTSFLHTFSSSEVDACIAHEIGNFLTKEVRMWTVIGIFSFVIEMSGLLLFILFLGVLHPLLFIVWAGLLTVALIGTIFVDGVNFNDMFHFMKNIFLVFNPVYLFLLFLNRFFYYMSGYGETMYADLKAIELTRYPQGLYSALSKMEDVLLRSGLLPSRYAPFLFAGESASTRADTSFTQSSIGDRKTLIRGLDPSVVDTYSPVDVFRCGACGHEIQTPLSVDGLHHKKVPVFACDQCGYVWFDRAMLYILSTTKILHNQFETYLAIPEGNRDTTSFSCPRCKTSLTTVHDPSIPQDISIHQCDTCDGDMMHVSDFARYVAYRVNTKW